MLPTYEEVKTDKQTVRPGDPDHPPGDEPAQRQDASSSTTTARPSSATRRPCRSARRTWTAIYGLPYTRRPHPMYTASRSRRSRSIKDSVTIMRGCFGGCTFCSITAHQGRIIQSRSQESILTELQQMGQDPEFKGVVSDIGGPTANMYQMRCTQAGGRGEVQAALVRAPEGLQAAGHRPRPARRPDAREPRGRRGSARCWSPPGVRMDLAQKSPEYLEELAAHHVGGHLKVAPEHTDPERPQADEEAGDQRLRGVRPTRSRPPAPRAGKEAVHGAVLHRLAPGQRPERDDRPGPVPEAQRLPARPGAGLHPRAVRHRHLHVLHRPRPVHGRGGLRRQAPARPQAPAGPAPVLQAARTTSRSARPC